MTSDFSSPAKSTKTPDAPSTARPDTSNGLTARQIRELEIKEMVESFDQEQTYEKYQYGDSNPFDSSHSTKTPDAPNGDSNPFDSSHSTGRLWNSSPAKSTKKEDAPAHGGKEEYERKSREWQANGGHQRF
jgi:hypothetical protein